MCYQINIFILVYQFLVISSANFATTIETTFSEGILNTGHDMRSMEETVTILQFENGPKGNNALAEIEIMKVTTSDHMLIIQNNNSLYKILQPLQDQTVTGIDSC